MFSLNLSQQYILLCLEVKGGKSTFQSEQPPFPAVLKGTAKSNPQCVDEDFY